MRAVWRVPRGVRDGAHLRRGSSRGRGTRQRKSHKQYRKHCHLLRAQSDWPFFTNITVWRLFILEFMRFEIFFSFSSSSRIRFSFVEIVYYIIIGSVCMKLLLQYTHKSRFIATSWDSSSISTVEQIFNFSSYQ